MMKIALDAMGGDYAPAEIVAGAVAAAREHNGKFGIILCGPKAIVEAELAKQGWNGPGIEIVDAPDLVAMDESPAQVVKTKQNSGLVTCVALQKKGIAVASVSAGNSGAMMAASLMILGRAGSVSRPAIALAMPSIRRPVVMLDMGANVDEKPSVFVDWAVCGSIFAECILGYENPKVALLNIGEEEKKGPEVIQEAHQLLKKAPLNFIGNVEGRDILAGSADVIVTPGYAGNIVLKLMEGFHEVVKQMFAGKGDNPAMKKFQEAWDYRNYGGGLLLGLNGTGIITHGRADATAIKFSLDTAYRFASSRVSEKIAEKLSGMVRA